MAKINKKDYSIRTLSYYQMKGGIYNDIISVLQRVRSSSAANRIMAPNKVLNAACLLYDSLAIESPDYDIKYRNFADSELFEYYRSYLLIQYKDISKIDIEAIFSVLAILITPDPLCVDYLLPGIRSYLKDSKVFKYFADLLEKSLNANPIDEGFAIKKLKSEMSAMEESFLNIISIKETEIQCLKNALDEQTNMANEALKQLANYENVPRLDKVITYSSAKNYMIRMRKYERVNQIMDMMSELTRGNTTAEEEQEIRELKDYLLSDNPREVHYHNDNRNSVVMQGIVNIDGYPLGEDPQDFLNWAIPAYNAYLRNGKK